MAYTLSAADKALLHAPHAVPINLDWQTCPICPDYIKAADLIVRSAQEEAWDEGYGAGQRTDKAAETQAPNPYEGD